jgi:uncharacterized OsmC-like protein
MTATGIYLGGLRTHNTHVTSQSDLVTDAPVDNHGKGEAFSPTDLVATALGNCAITTLAIEANRQGFDPVGLRWTVLKKMAPNPRRIAGVDLAILWEGGPPPEADVEKLKQAALHCPVAKSLHPDLVQTVEFDF